MDTFLIGWLTGLALVIVSAVWMGSEAARLRLSIDSKPYSVNNGAAAWVLSGLFLWIATFPYFLYKRAQAAAPAPQTPAPRSLAQELADLESLRAMNKLTASDYLRAKDKLLR